mmetsp:Transcript_14486/g.29633  ORF Transcript_14486/g.29633 Transcript_14486/m.29633 type:complete len:220 (-) Transcript_14486:265-924(-)
MPEAVGDANLARRHGLVGLPALHTKYQWQNKVVQVQSGFHFRFKDSRLSLPYLIRLVLRHSLRSINSTGRPSTGTVIVVSPFSEVLRDSRTLPTSLRISLPSMSKRRISGAVESDGGSGCRPSNGSGSSVRSSRSKNPPQSIAAFPPDSLTLPSALLFPLHLPLSDKSRFFSLPPACSFSSACLAVASITRLATRSSHRRFSSSNVDFTFSVEARSAVT